MNPNIENTKLKLCLEHCRMETQNETWNLINFGQQKIHYSTRTDT